MPVESQGMEQGSVSDGYFGAGSILYIGGGVNPGGTGG